MVRSGLAVGLERLFAPEELQRLLLTLPNGAAVCGHLPAPASAVPWFDEVCERLGHLGFLDEEFFTEVTTQRPEHSGEIAALRDAALGVGVRPRAPGGPQPQAPGSFNSVAGASGPEPAQVLASQTKALQVRREVFGERHPHTAAAYSDLSRTCVALGNHQQALEYARLALEIRREVLGERHPDTATSYTDLGARHWSLGNHKLALDCQGLALEIRREALGEGYSDTAASYIIVASIYGRVGEHLRALPLGR